MQQLNAQHSGQTRSHSRSGCGSRFICRLHRHRPCV